jgi:hypothetical protein
VQASQGRIPELRRVILATQDRVVMEDSFEKALSRLFNETVAGAPPTTQPAPGASPSPSPRPTATAAPTAAPTATRAPSPAPSATVAQLVRDASDQFDAAQAALRSGDFAEYGRRIAQLQDTLAKLRAATGQ